MTYDQLLSLDAIIKAGSFKAASERLHKSQPSVSVAIKKLEEEFDVQIFSREGYRPKLTEKGKAFYEKAKLALFHMHSLNTLGEELALGAESEIRVGVDIICPGKSIYCELRNFFQNYPKTNLHLSMDVISGTCEKLVKGEIQIGFFPLKSSSEYLDDFYYFPIAEVEMIPVISSTHENCELKKEEELKEIPQIVIESTGSDRSKSYGILEGGRRWIVTDIWTKFEIIKGGLGWGRLPDHMIKKELQNGELKAVKIPGIDGSKSQVFMVKNRKKALGPIARELWRRFKSS